MSDLERQLRPDDGVQLPESFFRLNKYCHCLVRQLQPQFIQQLDLDDPDWQQLCQTLKTSTTLAAIVLSAWPMALWLAMLIVEQQPIERAQATAPWSACPACGTTLVSKGWVKRQILTLVGQVEWKRRVGRCPHRC